MTACGTKEGNTGDPRQDFPQSAIREFKVYVSQAPAEYGWTAGGAVSFATKSGTNLFSGEVFDYLRNKAIMVQDHFSGLKGDPKLDYTRHQAGLALGGPIVTDKAHFFVAGEVTEVDAVQTVTVTDPEFYGHFDGQFDVPEYNRMVFTRADVQLTQNSTLFMRYAWQDSNFECEGCGGATSQPFFRSGGIQQKRYSTAGSHTWILSNSVVNELRGQFTNYHFRQHPPGVKATETLGDRSAARFDSFTAVYNFPSIQWGSGSAIGSKQISRQIRDDMTILMGSHTWKVGVGVQQLGIFIDRVANHGTWTINQDQAFNPDNLDSFVPIPGSVRRFQRDVVTNPPQYNPGIMFDGYLQDEWRAGDDVTLTLGLRYEYHAQVFHQGNDFSNKTDFPTNGLTFPPLPFVDTSNRGDKNNFGPRVGLAWNPNGADTVVRAGWGIYYNPMNVTTTGGERGNFRRLNVTINNPSYPDPYDGADPVSFASSRPQNIDIMEDSLENLQSQTFSGGVSQQLTQTIGLHVDAVYNKMTKVPMRTTINMRPGSFDGSSFRASGPRALTQFGRIRQVQSTGFMDYKALYVRLEKRFSDRSQFMVSYTLSDSNGDLSTISHSQNRTNALTPETDIGPAANDRRNVLVASGSVLLPFDVQVSGVASYRSTLPMNSSAGIDIDGNSQRTDYVPGIARASFNRGNNQELLGLLNNWRASQGRGAISLDQIDTQEYFTVDMRLMKRFALPMGNLEVFGQVFNLFNRVNLTRPQTNSLSGAFGVMGTAFAMRQGEIAARFSW